MVLIMSSLANRNTGPSRIYSSLVFKSPLLFHMNRVFSAPGNMFWLPHKRAHVIWVWVLYLYILGLFLVGERSVSAFTTLDRSRRLLTLKLVFSWSCCHLQSLLRCKTTWLSRYVWKFTCYLFVWLLLVLSVGWNCNRLLVNELCSEKLGYQGLLSSCLPMVNVTAFVTLTV